MDDFDPTAFEQMLGDLDGGDEDGEENFGLIEDGADAGDPKIPKQQPFKQAILICVDLHAASDLFPSNPNDETVISWKSLIQSITEFLKSRIISNEHDKIGVTFFGTQITRNEYKLENIYELIPLDFLSSQAIGKVSNCAEMTYLEFIKKIGTLSDKKPTSKHQIPEVCPISSLFRYALRTFRIRASTFKFTRKLLLCTHRSDPCQAIPRDRPVATQLGLDLIGNNIVLDVLPLALKDAPFDLNEFYAKLLDQSTLQRLNNLFEEDVSSKITNPARSASLTLLKDLRNELKRRAVRQRVLQKVHCLLAPGIEIGVAIFIIVSEAVKSRPVLIRARDQRPVYALTTWIDEETGDLLAPEEMRKFYDFNGQRVVLSPEEVLDVKTNLVRPSYEAFPDQKMPTTSRMILMGFKPLSLLHRRRHSYKMQVYYGFPVDAEIDGSGIMFRALIESMAELGKIAIFAWQFRNTSNFKVVAGIPHLAEEDDMNAGGMFLLPIPYADDIRDIHVETDPELTEEYLDRIEQELGENKFSEMLEAIDLGEDFNVSEISNPALTRHYQALEALALGEMEIAELEDATMPDPSRFAAVSRLLTQLNNSLELGATRSKKRSVNTTKATAEETSQIDNAQLKSLSEAGRLDKLTVSQLQDALKCFGLKRTGRKAELVDRITAYFKSKE